MGIENYIITYIGEGKFQAETIDGPKSVGKNLKGIIGYTYFSDSDKIPEIGWNVTRVQLMTDYLPKVQRDVIKGVIKPTDFKT